MSFLPPNIKMVLQNLVLQADIDLYCHPQFHAFTCQKESLLIIYIRAFSFP